MPCDRRSSGCCTILCGRRRISGPASSWKATGDSHFQAADATHRIVTSKGKRATVRSCASRTTVYRPGASRSEASVSPVESASLDGSRAPRDRDLLRRLVGRAALHVQGKDRRGSYRRHIFYLGELLPERGYRR